VRLPPDWAANRVLLIFTSRNREKLNYLNTRRVVQMGGGKRMYYIMQKIKQTVKQ